MKARYLVLIALLWIGSGCKKNVKLTDDEVLSGGWSLSKYQVSHYKNGTLVSDSLRTDYVNMARFAGDGGGNMSVIGLPKMPNDSIRYTLNNKALTVVFKNTSFVIFDVKALDRNTLTLESKSALTTDSVANQLQTIRNYFYVR